MQGKVALVTGGSSGIGQEKGEAVAAQAAQVEAMVQGTLDAFGRLGR